MVFNGKNVNANLVLCNKVFEMFKPGKLSVKRLQHVVYLSFF